MVDKNNGRTCYRIEDVLMEEVGDKPSTEIKIINAAIKSFSEKGYYNTKTKDIAKEAKLAEGTIFRYYKTKEELFTKLYPMAAKILLPRIIRDLTKRIESYGKKTSNNQAVLINQEKIALIKKKYLLFKAIAPEIIYRKDIASQLFNELYPEIVNIIKKIKAENTTQSDVKDEVLVRFIIQTVISYALHGFIDEKALFREDLDSDIKQYVDGISNMWNLQLLVWGEIYEQLCKFN